MKIAYLSGGYTNSGGMEKMLASKANYLADRGYKIYILTKDVQDKVSFFDFSNKIEFIFLKSHKGRFVGLNEKLDEIAPDICIATGFEEAKLLKSVKNKCKKVLEVHFSKYRRKYFFGEWEKKFWKRLIVDIYSYRMNKLVKKFDKFIVLTQEDSLSWRGIPNLMVISNPLISIPNDFAKLDNKKIISVGRFTYQKGYNFMIEMWQMVHQKYPDWELHVFGNGRKKKKYENEIEKKGLTNSFIIHAPTPNIETEYLNSSIYVQTSRYEGQPLAIMEAMSHGIPVISFACKSGPGELIRNEEDGFLIPFKNTALFAEKVCYLIENETNRKQMGEKARKNIQRYNQDEIMQQWIGLFNELVNKQP